MTRVMLHRNEIIGETNAESNLSSSDGMSDLGNLRKLLLGSEYQDLLKLQQEFSDHSHTSEKISHVISEAIAIRSKQDDSVSTALVPSVEDAIRVSAKRDPKRLANALFPVMGPAIRESVAETFAAMMQQMNQLMENSFSARSVKWRIDAFRTKRTFAEVMLSETFVYQVEQVFLIQRESSLLINHLTSANAIVKDPDMVSSMLTVVTDFVKDSFVVDKQQNVKSIKFGQLNLLFEAGPHAVIVAAVRGLIPSNLQISLREQLEELHRLYASKLEVYDGNAEQFPDTYQYLEKCLLSKKKNDDASSDAGGKKKLPWPAIIAVSLLVLAPIAWWLFNKIEQNKWDNIVSQLQAESGIIILDHHKQGDTYVINGLRDPLAKDPEEVVASTEGFNRPIEWQLQSYYSNENEIVKQRLHKVLDLPAGVMADLYSGQLIIKGQAEPKWIASLSEKLPYILGINSVDTSQLQEIEDIERKIQQLVGLIEGVEVEFDANSSELSSNHRETIAGVLGSVRDLQSYMAKAKRTFKIGVLGFADRSGTAMTNIIMSDRRARSVHSVLVENGIAEETFLAKGLGEFENQSEFTKELKCTSQRCVVFEVYLN